jgi:hypothetical protein
MAVFGPQAWRTRKPKPSATSLRGACQPLLWTSGPPSRSSSRILLKLHSKRFQIFMQEVLFCVVELRCVPHIKMGARLPFLLVILSKLFSDNKIFSVFH